MRNNSQNDKRGLQQHTQANLGAFLVHSKASEACIELTNIFSVHFDKTLMGSLRMPSQ